MASRTGTNIFGLYYVVSINATGMPFHMCTLNSEKMKSRTESCFILFLKLNDHQIRCFNFGLLRCYSCKFELMCNKFKSNTEPS